MDEQGLVFIAPKSFKNGRLILGRYRPIDLAIVLLSSLFTLVAAIVYVAILNGQNAYILLSLVFPPAIAFMLTLHFTNVYHNLLEVIRLAWRFMKRKKRYIWEGLYYDEVED